MILLSPLLGIRLGLVAAFLDRQLAPGTPVVSLSFWFRDRTVAASRQSAGLLGAAALYRWPARRDDLC